MAGVQEGKEQASAPEATKKEQKQKQQKEKQLNVEEILALESNEVSDAQVIIEAQGKCTHEQRAGTGQIVKSTSANSSATPMSANRQTSMEVEQGEEENEILMETGMPT